MFIIYRGDNPKELIQIEEAMNKEGISYEKYIWQGFVGPLTISKLFQLLQKETSNPYLQRIYSTHNAFEIKINPENESQAIRLIENLNLSHPIISLKPSVYRTTLLIFGALLFLLFLAIIIKASFRH